MESEKSDRFLNDNMKVKYVKSLQYWKTVQQSGKAFATYISEKGFISLIIKEIKRYTMTSSFLSKQRTIKMTNEIEKC